MFLGKSGKNLTHPPPQVLCVQNKRTARELLVRVGDPGGAQEGRRRFDRLVLRVLLLLATSAGGPIILAAMGSALQKKKICEFGDGPSVSKNREDGCQEGRAWPKTRVLGAGPEAPGGGERHRAVLPLLLAEHPAPALPLERDLAREGHGARSRSQVLCKEDGSVRFLTV